MPKGTQKMTWGIVEYLKNNAATTAYPQREKKLSLYLRPNL